MKLRTLFRMAAMGAVASALGSFAPAARADLVNFGESTGFGISSNLTLTLAGGATASATLGPLALATGTAPPAYSNTATVATADATLGSFLGLGNVLTIDTNAAAGTNALTSTASSNVDGLPGPRFANAESVINNLNASVLTLIAGPNAVLNISATTIDAFAQVAGTSGSLTATGSSVVENLQISLFGQVVFDSNANATGMVSVAPNTGVDVSSILGGVSIVLNEQLFTGDGISDRGAATNAIAVRFTNVGVDLGGLNGLATLNGELIIGHADARLRAVPEPSSLALFGLGGTGAALAWRRRHRARTA